MFGLEIRKLNKANLFADVDRILSKDYELEKNTLIHALQKMLETKSYFDICTVEKCAVLCRIIIPAKDLKIYNCIHCVSWNAMEEEYREYIVAMVLNTFRTVLN